MGAVAPRRARLRDYLLSIGLVALALGLRILLLPLTGAGAPFVIFFGALLIATFYGGFGPGLVALLLSLPVATYSFMAHADSTWAQAVTQAGLFALDGLLAVFLVVIVAARLRQRAAQVTEALAHSEGRFRGIFEMSPVGIAIIDSHSGQFVEVNPKYCDIVGYTRADMQQTDFMALTHPEDLQADLGNMEALRQGRVRMFSMEKRYLHRRGHVVWVELTVVPLWLEGQPPDLHLAMVQDITERKSAREELLSADRRKDEFLAMLSHELRNPLAAIRASMWLLGRGSPGGQRTVRAQAIIERQVGQLSRLIDDLLDVSRIGRGKLLLQREPLELNDIVWRALDDHRSLFDDRGIALEQQLTSEGLWTNGDAARLGQLLGNLLSNALKFTSSGGHVWVGLERERAEAILRVRDSGVGISEEDLPRLFEPFTQLAATSSRTEGGMGLGLALVKGIADLHGGSVTASSAGPGQGAEFTVQLPLQAAPSRAAEPSVALSLPARRRVLIIEDNRDVATALEEVLQLLDQEVEVAFDGQSGITAARQFKPDVVLCDLGLPGLDGYQVARQLRADPLLSETPLVALSGYGQPEDRRRSAEAGFTRHLVKPVTPEDLARVVDARAK